MQDPKGWEKLIRNAMAGKLPPAPTEFVGAIVTGSETSLPMLDVVRRRCPLHNRSLVGNVCTSCNTEDVTVGWMRMGYDGLVVVGIRSDESFQQQGIPEASLAQQTVGQNVKTLTAMVEAVTRAPEPAVES